MLDINYLYYDKRNKTISYIYIPSAYGCSGYDSFYEMAVEISKMMSVSDAVLENKVLKAIMNDFNPVDFLQMLKDYTTQAPEIPQALPVLEYRDEPELPAKQTPAEKNDITGDDIEMWQELEPLQSRKDEKDAGGYKFFGRRNKKKKMTQDRLILPETVSEKNFFEILPVVSHSEQIVINQDEALDVTQSASTVLNGTGLRYVGRAHLPPSIQVIISEGEIFTIGRFDAAIGKKQSDFEFERKTKAVSRRHAVIERNIEGYKIVDLSSSAGTFVNDKRIPSNTPYGLETGYRVSFGNSGADYVWENN